MKTNRALTLVGYLVLTGLAICFSAARLSAKDWRVMFSLPSETHWGESVLPAGDYTLLFDTVSNRPMLLDQGNRHIAMLGVLYKETPRAPAKSQLLIVGKGKTAAVHIPYIAELGTAFHFKVPESYEVYTQLIARADEPIFIRGIPVTAAGK